jgi:hypothetical protein
MRHKAAPVPMASHFRGVELSCISILFKTARTPWRPGSRGAVIAGGLSLALNI